MLFLKTSQSRSNAEILCLLDEVVLSSHMFGQLASGVVGVKVRFAVGRPGFDFLCRVVPNALKMQFTDPMLSARQTIIMCAIKKCNRPQGRERVATVGATVTRAYAWPFGEMLLCHPDPIS